MSVDQIAIEIQDRQDPRKSEVLDRWESYSVKSSVWDSCDTFTMRPVPELYDKFLAGGQRVWIYCNGILQLTGLTDERASSVSPGNRTLSLSGRDMASLLVDSAAEPQCLWNQTLRQLAERQCSPWLGEEIPSIETDNAPNFYKLVGRRGSVEYERINVSTGAWGEQTKAVRKVKRRTAAIRGGKSSPYYRGVDQDRIRETWVSGSERRWELLEAHAKRVACHLWMQADGSLFIGRPRYNEFPYQTTLKFKKNGSGNVLAARFTASSSERFSHYTFRASGRSGRPDKGVAVINRRLQVCDYGSAFFRLDANGNKINRLYRPTSLTVKKGCHDTKLLRRIARTQVEWSLVQSYNYELDVEGHKAPNGWLWEPDACVDVDDEIHGRVGPHYIVSRAFRADKTNGIHTTLKLIPAGIWLAMDHDVISDSEWRDYIAAEADW